MGLFSTKKKTVASTSISRLVEDKDIVNPIQLGTLTAVMDGSDIPETVRYYNNNSYFQGVRLAKRLASKGKYVFGSVKEAVVEPPSETTLLNTLNTYLQDKYVGQVIDVNSYTYGLPDLQLAFYQWLAAEYGYDIVTNTMDYQGITVYLQDAFLTVTQDYIDGLVDYSTFALHGFPFTSGETPTRTADYTRPHTAYEFSDTASQNVIEGVSVYEVTDVEEVTETYTKDGGGQWVLSTSNTAYQNGSVLNDSIEDGVTRGTTTSVESVSADGLVRTVVKSTDIQGTFKLTIFYDYADYIVDASSLDELDTADTELLDPYVKSTKVLVDEHDYLSVSYFVDGVPHYEMIPLLTGQEPSIDAVFQGTGSRGIEYPPRIYMRLNGIRLDDDAYLNTPIYKTSKFLTKRIGLDYDDLINNIHDNVGSLEKIKEIFLTWALSPNDAKNPLVAKYLFLFIQKLYNSSEIDAQGIAVPKTYTIADTIVTSAYGHNGIKKVDVTSATDAGYHVNYIKDTISIISPLGNRPIVINQEYHEFSFVDDEGVAVTYLVSGLFSQNFIVNSYSSKFSGSAQELFLPLDVSILEDSANDFILRDRNLLTGMANVLYFNTVAVVKTKWYQRGAFKLVMVLVAVALAFTGNPVGFSWVGALNAVATSLFIGFAIDVAARILVKLGVNAQLVAVAYIVASLIIGKVNGAAITAKNVLMSVNSALKIHNKMITIEAKEFEKKALKTLKDLEDKMQALDEYALDMLGNNVLEMVVNNRADQQYIGETSDQFLIRTTTVNVAQDTLDFIYGYTRLKLQLPQGVETIQQMMEKQFNDNSTDESV